MKCVVRVRRGAVEVGEWWERDGRERMAERSVEGLVMSNFVEEVG